MKPIKAISTWINPDTDKQYEVHATIYPGAPGYRAPFSRFQEPDDPDEVEINLIYDIEENEVSQEDLTPEQMELIEYHILSGEYVESD